MDENAKVVLREFVGDNWGAFEALCESLGADPQDIYVNELGGESE